MNGFSGEFLIVGKDSRSKSWELDTARRRQGSEISKWEVRIGERDFCHASAPNPASSIQASVLSREITKEGFQKCASLVEVNPECRMLNG